MRLDKYLGNMGCGSRKELKILIKKGGLRVNGQVEKTWQTCASRQGSSGIYGAKYWI